MNSKSEINKIKNPLINYFLVKRFLKCHNFNKSKFINKRLNTGEFGFHFHTRIIMCRNKKGYLIKECFKILITEANYMIVFKEC